MGIQARGVAQIKTLSAVRGSGIHSNERHVHQFQIASLELEHSRRIRERQAAVNRVNLLDTRLLEIDALIRKHQEALGVASTGDMHCDKPMPEKQPGAIEKRRTIRY